MIIAAYASSGQGDARGVQRFATVVASTPFSGFFGWIALLCLTAATGCLRHGESEVIVYTAQDAEFAQGVFDRFTQATGIAVRAKFDTESTKSVGLTQTLLAERARPRCDVFWNNEILGSLRLEKQGLLLPFRPAIAATFPKEYQAADGAWHGFAARARVLLVNTKRLQKVDFPTSIEDLTDQRLYGEVGMAKPLFGTTATHAACLFAVWGPDRAKAFFKKLKVNDIKIMSGNKQVARAVSSGDLAFGITDTDDAIIEVESGADVAIVYPDRRADQLGTLFIPNTVVVLRGAPHASAALKFAEFLLRPDIEEMLAQGPSAQIPLGSKAQVKPRIETPLTVHAMAVDFAQAAQLWDETARFLRDEFTGP